MYVAARLAGAAFTGLGILGADQVTSNGPDLAGIALVITAISGLIATVGGLFIATRRKPMDPADAALLAIAAKLTEQQEPKGPDGET